MNVRLFLAAAFVCLASVSGAQVVPPDASTGTASGVAVDPAINGNADVDSVLRDLDTRPLEDFESNCTAGQVVKADGIGGADCADDTGDGGSSVALDLGNDGDDSTGIDRITTGSSSTVFSMSPADTLLIDPTQPWATATALAADPADCAAGSGANAIDAAGVLTCTDFVEPTDTSILQADDLSDDSIDDLSDVDMSGASDGDLGVWTGSDFVDFSPIDSVNIAVGWGSAKVAEFFKVLLGGEFEACDTGWIRGWGYDTTAQCYQHVCGNFSWTSEVGGTPCINSGGVWDCSDWLSTPTHAGGSGFDITCDCDTIDPGTGRCAGDNACEVGANSSDDGAVFHINADPDIALAFEMACIGGEVLLPNGVYVEREGGFKNDSDPTATYNADGTPDFDSGAVALDPPITRFASGLRRVHWQLERGIRLVAEETDPDGRYISSNPGVVPMKSGVWIVNDQNSKDAYCYGCTCSGGANDGNPCVHASIDCPGGTCSGGHLTSSHPNVFGNETIGINANTCSLVDEGGGDYSCNPDAFTGTVPSHGLASHSGTMKLLVHYDALSTAICLSGKTDDASICDKEPYRTTNAAGDSCTTGSVDVGPAKAISVKEIWEERLNKGVPATIYAELNHECSDGTADCVDPNFAGSINEVFQIDGAWGKCSVSAADCYQGDDECPAGQTCDLQTCAGGDGYYFFVDDDKFTNNFPFHGGYVGEDGGSPDADFTAVVIREDALAPVYAENGSYTDNNYYDASVATSNCNGCPADASGAELWEDSETIGMGQAQAAADRPGVEASNLSIEWVSTATNSIIDGNGVHLKDSRVNEVTKGRFSDSMTFWLDHSFVENVSGRVLTIWNRGKVTDSTIRNSGAFNMASTNALFEFYRNSFDSTGGIEFGSGSVVFANNQMNGVQRPFIVNPFRDVRMHLCSIRDNIFENVGAFSNGSYGRDAFSISDLFDTDDSSTHGRCLFDNNEVTTQRANIILFHYSGRDCPNGTGCPSPTPIELGRVLWTFTNNTFHELENVSPTALVWGVEPNSVSVDATTAADISLDRFQPIRTGNTLNGVPLPDFPWQCGSIADAPTAAEGPIGEYCFYDDDPGGHCVDTVAGTLDLSASAAFTCDGGSPADCDLSICVLHADGTWDEK